MRAGSLSLDAALQAELAEAIARATGSRSPFDRITEVGGGSISRAFCLQSEDTRCFLKLNHAERYEMFAAEADGLEALATCGGIRVPHVLACGVCGPDAYLLLEHVALTPLRDGNPGRKAGLALADLHRIEGERFGWHRDNFIGSSAQHNRAASDWPTFFACQRLAPQIELARQRGIRGALVTNGERLIEGIPALFTDHTPKASLLHGDLWSGNAALDDAGKLTLFDPAVHYGDRECDLAMMQLFGGFPAALFASYLEAWPLASGFRQRKTLYQLYHVLNHMNLFGGGYQSQADRMIRSLLAELA